MSRSHQATSKGAPAPPPLSAHAFFGSRPIFRFEDFEATYLASGRTKAAARAVVDHHVRTGRLVNIRRGIFRYVDHPFDPYALGSQLSTDAVIAYGSAVDFHRLL